LKKCEPRWDQLVPAQKWPNSILIPLADLNRGHSDLLYSFTIAFSGAVLFVLVDKYERDGPMSRLLKFLLLFVAAVAITHKLQPYGLALF
jgi:hypothetical protein